MKLLLLLVSLTWLPLNNESGGTFQVSDESKITVTGTSNVHIWNMDTRAIKGEAEIEVLDNEILSIKKIAIQVPVESLKSGLSVMDNDVYKTLQADYYPTISFQLKGFGQVKSKNGKQLMEVSGDLNIAGKIREEKIAVAYRTDKNGNLYIKGLKDIRLSDYGVQPPALVFETVKVGNEITLAIDLCLARVSVQ